MFDHIGGSLGMVIAPFLTVAIKAICHGMPTLQRLVPERLYQIVDNSILIRLRAIDSQVFVR